MVWRVLKITFTHPHYSALGTVAASRLRTPSRLLTPLPLVLINTEHFEVKKVWRLSQNQKSSFSFLSCPSLFHFNPCSPHSSKNIVPSRKSSSTCRRGRPRSPRRRTSCRASTAEPSSLAASLRACAGSSRGTTKTSRSVVALSRYLAVAGGEKMLMPSHLAVVPNWRHVCISMCNI